MSEKADGAPSPPWRVYVTNRPQAVLDEADKYRDEWVAFSADGTRVIAHHPDPLQLAATLDAAGIDSEEAVFSYIPLEDAGESWIGGLISCDGSE